MDGFIMGEPRLVSRKRMEKDTRRDTCGTAESGRGALGSQSLPYLGRWD